MEVLSKSTRETKKLATELAPKLKEGNVLALWGYLGTGKTTFTKYLVQALGVKSRVQSPSFVIQRRYSKKDGNIRVVNHLDLYRLGSKEEIVDLGFDEIISEPNAITIIEWPEAAKKLLPKDTIHIKFEYGLGDERKICFTS